MGDVGILASLSGIDNWGEKRAAKARELQYAALMNQMAEGDLQKQHLAGQQMQEYMNTVGKLKLLDPAIERVRAVNDELIRPIQEGIRNAGGDIKKYMLSGGINQLQKYKEQLINNPTVQKDLMSAFNYNKYSTDVQAGLTPRGNAQEDYNNYSKGTADYFQYQGGYKAPDLTGARKYFGETFGADKYAEQKVDPQTFYQFALQEAKKENLNDSDAQHFATQAAQKYLGAVNQGAQPYMFKSLDPSIKLMNEARSRYYSGKAGVQPQGSTFYKTWLNSMPGSEVEIKPDHTESTDWNGKQATIGHIPLSVKQVDAILGGHGMMLDKGKIANPETIIQQDNLYTTDGRKLAIGGLKSSQLEITPLPWLVDVNEKGKESVSGRNNNPGNLVFIGQAGATESSESFKDKSGKVYHYAKFKTPQEGLVALKKQVVLDASRGMTLEQFTEKYAPTDDVAGNNSSAYADLIRQKLGITGNPPLQYISPDALVSVIPQIEGQGTPGKNAMKGMAFSIRIPESAAGGVKIGDEDLDRWFTHATARGMKKDRHWWDENGYTLQVIMPASASPGVMTQIEDAEGGLMKRQMQDFGGSLDMMNTLDLQRTLNIMDEDAQ